MMAFVRELIFCETSLGSRFSVSTATSANTGVAPWYKTQFAVAQKVSGVVIASSPGPNPRRKSLLELADLWPRSQPVRFQRVNHRLDISVIQALSPVRQQFFPHWLTTVDGQRFRLCGQSAHAWQLMLGFMLGR